MEEIRRKNIALLNELQVKMDSFSRTLYLAQLKKFDFVEEVHNTEKHSGKTLGNIVDEQLVPFIEHILTSNKNIHTEPYEDILPN